ncbi:dUTP pyrophosphatase [Candidatus Epulonipiscium fishelsonii]|uniref:dUTP pyrophosphatase n=1 Tax=Candidatus Epulonipiscium fishelsonii TaxID=77094 RepID=A0ACC8XB91_9FIRM|nr:dUTP pyrophosphatase [Epulopiscium sp. SCG-B05WGA-EpuloA1]ONI39784.1 dUTP pyrophosphatase [Epulopiscium sp. SCG-B11WGA-EpuloA1]
MSSCNVYFSRINPNAVIPSKREEDAGFDIYACFEEEYLFFKPHETKLVPAGIASAFSSEYVILFKERGSTGSLGIGQRAGVIDSGFRGEWFVGITNHNSIPLVISKESSEVNITADEIIYPYKKAISQCIILKLPKTNVVEIQYEELLKFKSIRGTGKLSSSGK